MWAYVYNSNGVALWQAWFNYPYYNDGYGWYYVSVGSYQNVCASATEHETVCGNNGTVPNYPGLYMTFRLPVIEDDDGGGGIWT